jgi:4-hydroxy-3-methylbut-2-enyl diphosphate reductase IspH
MRSLAALEEALRLAALGDGPADVRLEAVDAQKPVAITAHGVGPQVLQELTARGARVVDTTCPIVTRAQTSRGIP